jgi:hypothetical protein
MAPEFLSGKLQNSEALTEALIGTLVSSLGPTALPGEYQKQQQLNRIKKFIDENLSNPELSPGYIANASRVSLRPSTPCSSRRGRQRYSTSFTNDCFAASENWLIPACLCEPSLISHYLGGFSIPRISVDASRSNSGFHLKSSVMNQVLRCLVEISC